MGISVIGYGILLHTYYRMQNIYTFFWGGGGGGEDLGHIEKKIKKRKIIFFFFGGGGEGRKIHVTLKTKLGQAPYQK